MLRGSLLVSGGAEAYTLDIWYKSWDLLTISQNYLSQALAEL